jgi:transposase
MGRAERAFRSMKSVLGMEPVYHWADHRIVSHAHLCLLAYLLMRIAEKRVEESWPLIREKVEFLSAHLLRARRPTPLGP